MTMFRRFVLLVSLCALALTGLSCSQTDPQTPTVLRAYRIVSNEQIIQGPASRSEIGDFMLENDQIRVVIQDITYNRGSGIFGGSLIDADIKRPGETSSILGREGKDSFGEMFPAFFLEAIDPETIEIVNDGSDGKAAVVEVKGRGGEFVTMLRLFNQIMVNSYDASANLGRAINGKPPSLDLRPQVEFIVRYTLEPGARHVRIDSAMRNVSFKTLEFPNAGILATLKTFLGIDLTDFSVPTGMILGLGKLNSPFLPGIGYDLRFGLVESATERQIDLPAIPGHRTPFVGTSNPRGVNYGFAMGFSQTGETPEEIAQREHFVYNKDQKLNTQGQPFYGGDALTDDMLFLFYASGFGGVFTHQIPEKLSPDFCTDVAPGDSAQQVCEAYLAGPECSNDKTLCDVRTDQCVREFDKCVTAQREGTPALFNFTTYFFVGDGDVSSLWDEYYKVRKQPTELVQGRMLDQVTGSAAGAEETLLVYKARASDQTCTEEPKNTPTIWSQVFTKTGGVFQFRLPAGKYCYRTRGEGRPLGDMVAFEVVQNESLYIEPMAMAFGVLDIISRDSTGTPIPAKVSIVGIHDDPKGVPPYKFLVDLQAGEPYRTTDFEPDDPNDPSTREFVEAIDYTDATGRGRLRVRPGDYTVVFSRGTEFNLSKQKVSVKPGITSVAAGTLKRSVDTSNYVSADFHMHAQGSIDSGLSFSTRVLSLAAEGLEVVAATDHNYVSDYAPFITAQGFDPFLKSMIGLELTTFEAGHFNGFPVRYQIDDSTRGSFEWQNQAPGLIFEQMRQMGSLGPDNTIVQVNHPRDSILGYFSQFNVDAFTSDVELPFNQGTGTDKIISTIASTSGPSFYRQDADTGKYESTFSWNFDAIEVFNGKRFELLRHHRATPEQLRDSYIAQYKELALEETDGYDADACVEARACVPAQDTDDACAAEQAAATLCDTQEQDALTQATTQTDQKLAGVKGPLIVCDGDNVAFPGHLDDWYNTLNYPRPYTVLDYEAQIILDPARLARYRAQTYRRYTATGNSDAHQARGNEEPGYPRNYVYVGHDNPALVTDQEIVTGLKNHNVAVTNGPFLNMTINGNPMGSESSVNDGKVQLKIVVRTADWVDASRYKVMANGEVINKGEIVLENGVWEKTIDLNIAQDTWFVVEVEGDNNLFPVLLPNELPPLDIESALGSLAAPFGFGGGENFEGLEPELLYDIKPFAFTNPIWVIADGDGEFTPPAPVPGSCTAGFFEAQPNALIDPSSVRPRGSKRHDSIRLPAPMHNVNLTKRLKGERKDVRLIFESFGHSH